MLVDDMPIATFESPASPSPRSAARQAHLMHRPATVQEAGHIPDHGQATAASSQVFNVRLADSAGRQQDAGVLLQRMYAWRGYALDPTERQDRGRVTFYAETHGELVGTMSLALDLQGRLPADENFGDRLAPLRRAGRILCEPSRLAIDTGMSKRVFAALIHISYLYAHQLKRCSDYVIEVNPRHVAFYQRMLGFADVGGERICSRVGAPAVLLRLPLDAMGARIRRWGGSFDDPRAERSFYPWFFPVREEAGISARLAALCQGEDRT